MRLNRETAGPASLINPHNEALAQWPLEDAEKKLNEAETFLSGESGHLSKLAAWKQKYFLGGPSSAGWEEFDDLVADAAKDQEPPPQIEPPEKRPGA